MNELLKSIYNRAVFMIGALRAEFWRLFVKRMGHHVCILNHCMLLSPKGIEMGDYVCINHHTSLSGQGGLKIGNYVMMGPNCNILTSNHGCSKWDQPMMFQEIECGPIEIGDDVWLGANVVILPHVCVGRGAVIGANAVVTENVEPYAIVGGVPARVLKYRLNEEDQKKAMSVHSKMKIAP